MPRTTTDSISERKGKSVWKCNIPLSCSLGLLAIINDSKSSYNSPAYALAVHGLGNILPCGPGYVEEGRGGCEKDVMQSQIKQKYMPATGINPHGDPPPKCFSCGTQSMEEASKEPESREGGHSGGGRLCCCPTPAQSMTAYLPPAAFAGKGKGRKNGKRDMISKHPQSFH